MLLVLGASGYAATRSSLLDVDHITVEGAGIRVTERTVIDAAAIDLGQPLLDVDLDAVDGRLTALPWVADATVRREWSGTIHLRILERSPVAVAVDPAGEQVLLDAVGAVLESVVPGTVADPTLPHIRVDAFGPPGSRVMGIGPLLRAAGVQVNVNPVSTGRIVVVYMNRKVRGAGAERLAAAKQAAAAVAREEALKGGRAQEIDAAGVDDAL